MRTPNVGWLFYVDYFRKENSLNPIDFGFLVNKSEAMEKLAGATLKRKCERLSGLRLGDYSAAILEGTDGFTLRTTYPGLLVGSGYQHEVHVEGEFKLGFFFDYATGLPVIPGSSVKGVLRSAFEIPELMHDLLPGKKDQDIRLLKCEIFEGVDWKETNHSFCDEKFKKEWKYLRSPEKDIFHDAITVGSDNAGELFLAADFITPHKHKENRALDPFANPTPLQFMKVLPEVKFRFQFDVKSSEALGISKRQKLELFRDIILNLGVGAKTRTGYGWMKDEASTAQDKQKRT